MAIYLDGDKVRLTVPGEHEVDVEVTPCDDHVVLTVRHDGTQLTIGLDPQSTVNLARLLDNAARRVLVRET